MRSSRWLIIVAATVFVATLMASLPARIVASLGGDNVTLVGASGTVWNGRARQIKLGTLQLGNTEWQTDWLRLLLGRLAVAVDTEVPGGYARGHVSASVGGVVRLADFEAAAPLESLGGMLGLPAAAGNSTVVVESALLEDGWPRALVGSVRLTNIPLAVGGVQGGGTINLLAEFDTPEPNDDGRLPAIVSDQGGPLEIRGAIQLYPPANYDIDALVNARADAPQDLRQGLLFLGPEGPNGARQFTMSGSL